MVNVLSGMRCPSPSDPLTYDVFTHSLFCRVDAVGSYLGTRGPFPVSQFLCTFAVCVDGSPSRTGDNGQRAPANSIGVEGSVPVPEATWASGPSLQTHLPPSQTFIGSTRGAPYGLRPPSELLEARSAGRLKWTSQMDSPHPFDRACQMDLPDGLIFDRTWQMDTPPGYYLTVPLKWTTPADSHLTRPVKCIHPRPVPI